MIEYQNEFCAEGGKLYDAVKGVMARSLPKIEGQGETPGESKDA